MTMVSPAVGPVRAASADLLAPNCKTSLTSVLGTQALLFYRLDEREHRRRRRSSASQIDSWATLETLMELPVGEAVPLASIPNEERKRIRSLPSWVAHRDQRMVLRHAVRPLSLDLAVVKVSNWRRGLELAGRFAPYCRRAMLLERAPTQIDEVMMEASFYGIGILVGTGDNVEMLLEPRPYRPERHTAAAWQFIEQLYAQLT